MGAPNLLLGVCRWCVVRGHCTPPLGTTCAARAPTSHSLPSRCRNRFVPYLCVDPVPDENPGLQDEEELFEVLRATPLDQVQRCAATARQRTLPRRSGSSR